MAILASARGGEKNTTGTKREQEEEEGKGGGGGGAMSCLWPERREGPGDMTDYRQGQSSRPAPRPQLPATGAGRGMWGAERGRRQERQVLVKESRGEKKEKGRKEKSFERIPLQNAQVSFTRRRRLQPHALVLSSA